MRLAPLKIAVLALQGDFAEHIDALKKCGAMSFPVRSSKELAGIDGLVIPGGESTTIAELTHDNSDPILETIKTKVTQGLPVYGTCMGGIFLAKEIEGSSQGRLALMDIKVRRNAFGPQRCSFQAYLPIPCLGKALFPAIFIRAPLFIENHSQVKVLASIPEGVVMARQNNMLVSAFHPELSEDLRVHQYFLDIAKYAKTADQ